MTAVACTQPGCGGTIQDGYCDVCGLAPDPAPAHVLAPPPVRARGSGGSIRYAGQGRAGSGASGAAAVPGAGPASGSSGPSGSGPSGSGPGGSSGAWGTGLGSAGSGSGPDGRGSRSAGSRLSRGRLGAGLVEVPPVPALDPAAAVLTDPQVPENRRFCSTCGHRVGRSRDGRPGLTEGFCPNDGTRYSFSPKLAPGELVAGQYEVLGCLAHGGLGWIYLARDHNVNGRWVVLKGLLNTGDADAMKAAVAEKRFLAQLEHPNIVRIYNFVQHTGSDGETADYIVMEYVGGKSLKQIRLDARQRGEAVPLAHALAYALEILPAFGYLHKNKRVYCDFKPDNFIQVEEQLKLIDMGGVRDIDDDGPIYGTVGYQAPEIETEGPSPGSDLYTVGRTLAVLTFDFHGFQGENQFKLPDDEPLLLEQESYARLLRRATHRLPARRFQSADEMAEQLTGVLREVLSVADRQPRPAFSGLFGPELRPAGTDLGYVPDGNGAAQAAPPLAADTVAALPAPLADSADAAAYLAMLAGLEPAAQAQALRGAVAGDAGVSPDVAESPDLRLALVRALIISGDLDAAMASLNDLSSELRDDWRVTWYTGLRALAGGQPGRAREAFSAVYDELPGELTPKLALAFAAEAAGDLGSARHYFELVWTIDRSYVSAAFGTARTCLAAGDRVNAIAAVAAVPETSRHHADAQVAAVQLLVAGGAGLSLADLRLAGTQHGRLGLEDNDPRGHELAAAILHAVLDWVLAAPPASQRDPAPAAGERILGCELNERPLRRELESRYRALAKLRPEQRVELVDRANTVRPRTLI